MLGILLEKVLHRLAAAFLIAVGHVMADDARIVLVADLVRRPSVSMPKPIMKPWSRSTSTVGWIRRQVEEADLGVLGLVAQRGRGPGADQLAGLKIVGGKGRVGGIERIERRVERDDQNAGIACLLDGRTMPLVSEAVIRIPLAPSAMQLSIAATWLSLSPSTLPA